MGPVPLSYSEIRAYQKATGDYVNPWEAGLVKRLSRLYVEIWQKTQKTGANKGGSLKNVTDMTDVQGLREIFGKSRGDKQRKPKPDGPSPA